jgi:hypothetical protein
VSATERATRFYEEFAAPLLTGERCLVGDPLGRDMLRTVQHGARFHTGLTDAIDAQLAEAALLGDVTPAPFDEDALAILYAVHELYAAVHPQSSSFYARAHLFCTAAEQAIRKLRHTYDPGRLVTRHLIVWRAFKATRTDVHLKWWTGQASFYGDEPPARLTSWPQLRRVNVDRKTEPLWRLAMLEGDEETRVARVALMSTLLDLSPLSRLFFLGDPVQKQLGFHLMMPIKSKGKRMSALYALDDRRLARAVTDHLLDTGVESAGSMLAIALLAAVRESSPPLALRRATELCLHLALMSCVAEGELPGGDASLPLRNLFDDDLKEQNDALRVYWSVVRAGLALDRELLPLPDESDLPRRARKLWRRLHKRLQVDHFRPIAEPLQRELERRLPRDAPAAA